MWDDFEQDRDGRSDDAKAFDLPLSAQGPTYFRYTGESADGGTFGIALILDCGLGRWNVGQPFARLAASTRNSPTYLSMGTNELIELASVLLDEVDRRRKLDVTLTATAPAPGDDSEFQATDLAPHQLPFTLPVDQIDRLARALVDAADSLEIYSRTKIMRTRNPDM